MIRPRRAVPARPRDFGSQRYRLLVGLAGAAVLWERVWPRLWPFVCIAGAFLAVALFDLLPHLPEWLHTAILVAFALALAAALAWAWPALRPVRHSAARARLERDSGLADRPLQAMADHLAAGCDDLLAEALWRHHRLRMAALIRQLRVRWPDAGMARHEPWGIRAGVLLLLVVAGVAGSADPVARLSRALDWQAGGSGQDGTVELWVTPPAYTGLAPMFRSTVRTADAAGAGPLSVPTGSTLLVRATGVSRAPDLFIAGTAVPFAGLGENDGRRAWRVEAAVTAGNQITVRSGRRELAAWPITVVADSPPRPVFDTAPKAQAEGLLALAYHVADDYGVSEVALVIEPVPAAASAGVSPLRVALPLATPGAPETTGSALQDFSASPMAGLPVLLHLEAKDAAGQVGSSDRVEAVLPEREFSHPVARQLVAMRKRLVGPAPSARERSLVAAELGGVTTRPEAFAGDIVVSLGLSVAQARLLLDETAAAVPSVRDLLWQTALRIEQGDVPFAEQQLEQARQALTEALQRDAPAAEIDQLMDALQQALNRYLEAAAAELARRGEQAGPVGAEAQMLRSDDLTDLIEAARAMARSGGRDGAMQMLSELQRMLDGLRAGLRNGNDTAMAEARALMQALHDLGDRQQRLLDETFQRLRDQQGRQQGDRPAARDRSRAPGPVSPGPMPLGPSSDDAVSRLPGSRPGGSSKGAGATEQQALRGELGDLMLRLNDALGGIPQAMGEADQAMKGAADALGQGRLGEAVPNQTRALDALQQAMQQTGQALAQKLGGGLALGEGDGGDIFGRRPDGRRGLVSGTLSIPDRGSVQRAKEIVDELRRRAAERSRPTEELDYIDRLLRRF